MMRAFVSALLLAAAAACAPAPPPAPPTPPAPVIVPGYGPMIDNGYELPAIPARYLVEPNRRLLVRYTGDVPANTIEIDPYAKFLYYVNDDGTAMRYPIAVGREGKSLRGTATIGRKEEWPGWQPTANMLRTEPEVYGAYRGGIPGGLRSPLGARALYLYRGGRDTYYRIHGTNDLQSIGNSGSAGCIRLFNQDVIDLYDRVKIGTKVVIRSEEDSLRLEGPDYSPRGVELPPTIIPPEELLGPEAVAADHKIYEDGTTPADGTGSSAGANG
ncbi:MAG: L,D-transpeptidase family protein [Limimaricola sp.]|nr:L,D-transpeptidase family protein [Limimaricola sp.]